MTDAASADAVDVALRVAAAVEEVGGAYFVGGSLASSVQGEPRATNDVDIVLELPLGDIRKFVETLGSDFEVDIDALRVALLNGSTCPSIPCMGAPIRTSAPAGAPWRGFEETK